VPFPFSRWEKGFLRFYFVMKPTLPLSRSTIHPLLRWHNWFVVVLLFAAMLAGLRLWPHAPLSADIPSSTAVLDDHGHLLRFALSRDDKYREWTPLADIPRDLVEAVQLHEDRWFRWHPGFNPWSLARGAVVTYVRGGSRQGGSTLTMQLVRLVHRDSTRTPGGKFVQVLRAVWLELRYSKNEILEAYLNLAPYGGNIEGVAAASRIYFDKPVAKLTLPESMTLAVLPQDPSRRMRNEADPANGLGENLRAARSRLYQRWEHVHGTDAANRTLFDLPLRLRPARDLPFTAPHAVEQALAESRIAARAEPVIRTTLDSRLQSLLERQVRDYLGQRRVNGLVNAAALLVDTRDMGIKALVGSADYSDASIFGQVNGTNAKRSPGSTLKPFIYALALDQGVLHPRTMLRDVPTSFGPFTPENFDGRFLGPVSATDALIRSRNIPAVQVASQLHDPDLYGFLKAAGISRMASERHYGLALVLGGGEVTMQELASLYAMLANRGELHPLRLRADDPQTPGVRLLSAEASFVALDMLHQNPRPDDASATSNSRLPVAWKTGTSWSFRDAWSVGTFGPYVLVVWLGNFDGAGNPSLIGVEAAAPLFFRVIDAIKAEYPDLAEPAWRIPPGVKRVEVCLASGDLPNAWCPRRGETWFLPGKSPIRLSAVHRLVHVDTRSGRVACPPYDPATTKEQVFEYWPSDLAKVFRDAGLPRAKPPEEGDCASGIDGDPPRITSPLRGASYTLRRKADADRRITFNATADGSAHTLYWFVDDAYMGASDAGKPLAWDAATAGRHRVRAVDDRGRADTRELVVEVVE
jgi:penicillin-binding protein 1C